MGYWEIPEYRSLAEAFKQREAHIEALEAALRDAEGELRVAASLTDSESLCNRFGAASRRARAALAQTGETDG